MSDPMLATIIENLQTLLGEQANELARTTRFVKRQRAITGSNFSCGLVFACLSDECLNLSHLRNTFQVADVSITRQGLDQRFTPEAVAFMEALLYRFLAAIVPAGAPQPHPDLAAFNGIYVTDSTTITLPQLLEDYWRATQDAGLKLSVQWDLQGGQLTDVHLHDAIEHDRRAPYLADEPCPGVLYLGDLGYFKLDYFEKIQTGGGHWISRHKMGTVVHDEAGKEFNLFSFLSTLDAEEVCCRPVQLGLTHRLPCYLVAQRATPEQAAAQRRQLAEYERKKQVVVSGNRDRLCDYIVYFTSVPPTHTAPETLLAIARLRWQIELLFRAWKTELEMDAWRTQNPDRILCELYAKLIAALIQHWIFAFANIHHLDKSWQQARSPVRHAAWGLLTNLFDTTQLYDHLMQLRRVLQGCLIACCPARPSNLYHLPS